MDSNARSAVNVTLYQQYYQIQCLWAQVHLRPFAASCISQHMQVPPLVSHWLWDYYFPSFCFNWISSFLPKNFQVHVIQLLCQLGICNFPHICKPLHKLVVYSKLNICFENVILTSSMFSFLLTSPMVILSHSMNACISTSVPQT